MKIKLQYDRKMLLLKTIDCCHSFRFQKKRGVVGHLRPALRGAARRKLLGEEARRTEFHWKPNVELEKSWGRESLLSLIYMYSG